MLNYIPRRHPSVRLLYGKKPIQRCVVGLTNQLVEIPTSVTDELYENVDASRTYHNDSYNPLRWKAYVKVKLDAHNMLHGDTTTALTQMDSISKLRDLHARQENKVRQAMLEKVNAVLEKNLKAPKWQFQLQKA